MLFPKLDAPKCPDYPARLENGRIILCSPLSLPFTPHDLERVQATLNYQLRIYGKLE